MNHLCEVRCAWCDATIAHMPLGLAWSGPGPICTRCTSHHPKPPQGMPWDEAAAHFLVLALRPENLLLARRLVRAAMHHKAIADRIALEQSRSLPELEINLEIIL